MLSLRIHVNQTLIKLTIRLNQTIDTPISPKDLHILEIVKVG